MAVPTSDVHICNLALDRLGIPAIASIETPTTANEDVCERHYAPTRREILRKYVFNFSKKLTLLTADANKVPAFGFATAYNLPNDFVRLMALGDVTVNADTPASLYDLSEGYIFTDVGDEDDGLKMQYIYDAVTISKYDPLFVRLFVLQLAANMAYKFTLKPSLIAGLLQELQMVEVKAAAIAGQEKPPRRVERSRWRARRQQGSSGNRDLRYT